VLGGSFSLPALSADLTVSVNPATLPAIGTVDKRFQSFNTEMLEVTGGCFWKPYQEVKPGSAGDLYAYRPSIDLSRPRLRKLAAALGPFYVRVSGTWANTTYFQDADGPAPATPPKGLRPALSRQWARRCAPGISRAGAGDIRWSESGRFRCAAVAGGVINPDKLRMRLEAVAFAKAFFDGRQTSGGDLP
jgi:hypothetical protein